jgi:hypothetical protein
MRFGTWNFRILYRVRAIKLTVGELQKYKLDLEGVQEFRWEGEGYERAENYTFLHGKGMLITNYGQDFSNIIESFQQSKG